MSIIADNVIVPTGQDCPAGYEPGSTFTYEDGSTGTIRWKRSPGLGALGDVLPLVLLGIVIIVVIVASSRPATPTAEEAGR